LPQFLRDMAKLDGSVMLVGAGAYFEIWSVSNWNQQNDVLQDTDTTVQRFAALSLPGL
jgi:DNA-binding transcriptional regulator/RsmH inhibitor MraZ